jgi:ABC-type nitrate/sulfonate/bicarbonate transport system substrate-binding protein
MIARRLLALPVALAVALLVACGGDDGGGSTEQRPVTLMLNWTPNAHHAGIYAAQAEGWYAEAGLDVTIVEPAGTGVEQAVAGGAATIGLAQAESLLPARAAGVPVVSVATLLPVNDSVLMGVPGITRPRDLEGKRYGGFGGALEVELVSRLVECDGGDPSTVEFVDVGNVDYLAGLQQDVFDVVWVFEGWDALRAAEVEGAEVSLVRFRDHLDCIPNWYTPLVLASEDTVADDPDVVSAFLTATARGYALAAEDPDRAAELLLEEVPELDPALVGASVRYYAPLFAEGGAWGRQDLATWTSFAALLDGAGLLAAPVDPATAFTTAFTDELQPA